MHEPVTNGEKVKAL